MGTDSTSDLEEGTRVTNDEWAAIERQFPIGTPLSGTVEHNASFGIFDRVAPAALEPLLDEAETDYPVADEFIAWARKQAADRNRSS